MLSMIEYTKERPLRVATAFSGYDSQKMALERLHKVFPDFCYELVAWSEIDENAITAHNAVFPEDKDKNLGDISKIDWSKAPDFDLFTYSFPCFIAGTYVITSRGLCPIEDVCVGDKVLTHNNEYREVVRTMAREYRGDMYRINAMPVDEIICTSEHPFYIRRRFRQYDKDSHKSTRLFGNPEWVKAKDLNKDTYVGIAINTNSQLPNWQGSIDNRWGHGNTTNRLSALFSKESFWYIMGRYVGDGWKRSNGSGIVICCGGRHEQELIDSFNNCGFNYSKATEKTVNKYHICIKELYDFVGRYGYYAQNKQIDGETINLPAELLKAFIDGYKDSDGCKKGKYYDICSTSRKLIYGIAQCIAKVYRMPYRIYRTKRKPTTIIDGRKVNQKDSYNILWKEEPCSQDKSFYQDGYIWCPIKEIHQFNSSELVYNLEVENDNSYTANGVIVHNCQDISSSGKQRGFEEGAGTRSSLLWECKKAIEAKKPRFLMMENVKALVSAKFLPFLRQWQTWLHQQGYENFTQVLNASDFNCPQNRERVFMISILRTDSEPNPSFYFPKKMKLERRIKDILEPNVDESFYLSDKALEYFCRVNNDKSHGHNFTPKDGEDVAFTVRCASGQRVDDNFLKYEE